MSATRVELVRDGARATKVEVGHLELQLLSFPAGHAIPEFAVERPYLVVVLAGDVAKRFGRLRWSLRAGAFATLPGGASHTSGFGPEGATVLTVRSTGTADEPFGGVLRRLRHVEAASTTTLGRRIAAELRAGDESWALAAEGLVLQLLATAGRAAGGCDRPRGASWLGDVRELLHERAPAAASLSELAASVGVQPAHLARSFRRVHGVTVGEYARGLRLDWAAAQLALPEAPLAEIAAAAGFADQSHFTRAFRRHTGVTPGRYRRLVR
jgi:AraC family transcriptional regulator